MSHEGLEAVASVNDESADRWASWRHRPAPLRRGGGVFWRHRRFLTREQVFDDEYLKAGEFSERRIEHARTGGLLFHRGRGLGKRDEQAHG